MTHTRERIRWVVPLMVLALAVALFLLALLYLSNGLYGEGLLLLSLSGAFAVMWLIADVLLEVLRTLQRVLDELRILKVEPPTDDP